MSILATHPLIGTPADTFDQWRRISVAKTQQPIGKRIPAAVFGGVFIAVGTLAGVALTKGATSPADYLLSGIALSCGITIVLISGCEFFTSNSALVGAVYWGDKVPWWMYLVDLARKLLGNFIGATLWALLTVGAGTFGYDATAAPGTFGALTSLGSHLCAVAIAKSDGPNAWELICRGGIIGILVSVGVFAALGMHSPLGRMAPVFLCVPCAVLAGGDHGISNIFIFAVATVIKCPVSSHGMYWRNLGLTTLGTFIFSFIFGSLLYLQNAMALSAQHAEAHKAHEPDSAPASIVSVP